MHEVGLMQSVLDVAIETAEKQGAEHIHNIKMRVGALSGVIPEALEFAFQALSQETMAEGAELMVEYLPVVCYCPACQKEFEPTSIIYECPQCKEPSADIRSGKELDIVSMEVS